MQSIAYDPNAKTYPIAILLKDAAFNRSEIDGSYVLPLLERGIPREHLLVLPLKYQRNGKAPASLIKEQLESILLKLDDSGTKTIYCADANYFKVLTKERKAEPHLGYVMKCAYEDYAHMDVIYGVNHKQVIHNPASQAKLDLSLDTLAEAVQGTYTGLGSDIIHAGHYPESLDDIADWLQKLHQYPAMSCDIEAFSLNPFQAGLGSITFCWSQHEGVSFLIDWREYANGQQANCHGFQDRNDPVRDLLRDFFESYTGRLRYHNASYDIKVLIYQLWMAEPQDYNGLLKGLEILTENFDDTKIIAYLATNSCAGNELGLKDLAHAFAGNWAEDVKDIRTIEKSALLRYNLVDGLSTNYVYDKHYPQMVADGQEEIYRTMMLPSLKTIIQMELVGMPMNPETLGLAKAKLTHLTEEQESLYRDSAIIKELEEVLAKRKWEKDYADRKAKAKNPDKILPKDWDTFPRAKYNPDSGPQTQVLLYELMKLPVIDYTKKRQPATGADTLETLVNHCTDPEHAKILEALVSRGKAQKILSTFIPAFERGTKKRDKMLWLHGSFNLGGTVSGRLSSSDPNMQNLPSGSVYGKLIKEIFQAPKGWIFCGADFASLEDRINALLTRDPNKLKVYTDGFDGHSLRTVGYWPDEFPDIDPNDPEQVNSLKNHPLRGKSKGPTFALTYLGTWQTLVKNSGFTPDEAKAIEANYHKLYGTSREWVEHKINRAANDGYTTGAFGLRIRTPLLKQTLLGQSNTPHQAEAEARSMGNAVSGQSYGLLTNRAANAVMERVWKSPYRFDILPVAMIHDAIYFIVRDNVDAIAWLNTVLIEEMSWQELPEIQHDIVKLGAELDVFYPSWADALTLPNGATREEIYTMCAQHAQSVLEDKAA